VRAAHVVEAEGECVVLREDEAGPRLEDGVGRHLLLDAELLEEGDHRRHQGLADDERRSLAALEERDLEPGPREIGGERGARGTRPQDRDAPDPPHLHGRGA
jgi:hypothetical protein